MAQVPYSPVPDIAPSVPGAPRVSIQADPAAFGAATAAATRQFGQQMEQSSNEMFQTYMYVKQLQNETWAKNEFVNQSQKLGQIESDFYGLKGQAAVAAMPKYADDVRGLYENSIANAPNPQAARFLGDSLSRRISYSLVDGQRHAGQQGLAAAGDASASAVAMGINEISKRPQDDAFFNDTLKSFDHEAEIQESLGNGKAQSLLLKWKNVAWEARFDKLVFDDPNAAQALLDQNKDDIPPSARKNIQAQIKNGQYTIRATQSFGAQQSRQEAEQTVGQIAARNIGTDPQSGQALINPRIYKELSDYANQNPAAEKDVQDRIAWAQKEQDRQQKGTVVQTSPDIMSALTGSMFDSARPTQERDVLKAETNGQLSHKDGTWLRTTIKERDGGGAEALKDPLFKIATDSARAMIGNPSNYAAFQYQFLTEYLKAKQEGTLKPGDLNISDPNSMIRKMAAQYIPGIGSAIRNNGGVGAPTPDQMQRAREELGRRLSSPRAEM